MIASKFTVPSLRAAGRWALSTALAVLHRFGSGTYLASISGHARGVNVLASVVVGAVVLIGASPYLAGLTLSVPDRDNSRWWTGRPASVPRVGLTALVGVGAGLLAGFAAGWSPLLPAYVALALAAVPLIVIDVEHHRLPDRLVLNAAASGAILLTLAALTTRHWASLARSGAAAVLVLAIATVLALIAPFGFGDTKLAAVLAAYLGWFSWAAVLSGFAVGVLLAAVAAMALVAARRASMKSAIPLGPALIAGALAVAAAPRFG
jgi:leader peptidase (prepilin peptidase)/N-methyltransferase